MLDFKEGMQCEKWLVEVPAVDFRLLLVLDVAIKLVVVLDRHHGESLSMTVLGEDVCFCFKYASQMNELLHFRNF